MPIPLLDAMEADVNVVGCLDKLVRKAGPAARTKNCPRGPEGVVHRFIPPAPMPEFHNIAPTMIKLVQNLF